MASSVQLESKFARAKEMMCTHKINGYKLRLVLSCHNCNFFVPLLISFSHTYNIYVNSVGFIFFNSILVLEHSITFWLQPQIFCKPHGVEVSLQV